MLASSLIFGLLPQRKKLNLSHFSLYTFSHRDKLLLFITIWTLWLAIAPSLSPFYLHLRSAILRIVFFRYCVAGTVGHKLSRVKLPTKINVDESTQIDVRCQVLLFLYPLKFI